MGEETEVVEAAENGTTLPEKTEAVMEKKEEEDNGLKEMEEDNKGDDKVKTEQVGTEKMDEDLASKEEKENKEVEEKEETKTEVMEEDTVSKENEASEEKEENKENVEEKEENKENVDGLEEKEKGGELKDGKRSRKRGKGRSGGVRIKDKVKELEEKKVKEPRTPAASTIARPVRERKSVERLVASIERDSTKEFHIEKVVYFVSLIYFLFLDVKLLGFFYISFPFLVLFFYKIDSGFWYLAHSLPWKLQGRGTALKDIPNGMVLHFR